MSQNTNLIFGDIISSSFVDFFNHLVSDAPLLFWLLVSLMIVLILSYNIFFLEKIPYLKKIQEITHFRLYLGALFFLVLIVIFYWYTDSQIIKLPRPPTISFLLYGIIFTILFGLRISIITLFFVSGLIFYYLYDPAYSPTHNFSSLLFATMGYLSSIGIGAYIRYYQRSSASQLSQMQLSLDIKRNEEAILRSTNKAALVISSHRLPTNKILKVIAEESRRLLKAKYAGISLIEENLPTLPVVLTYTGKGGLPHRKEMLVLIQKILSNHKIPHKPSPVIINLSHYPESTDCKKYGFDKMLIMPIITEGKVTGALFLANIRSQFTSSDCKRVQLFAAHAATAILDVRYHEVLQQAIALRDQLVSIASHELKTPLNAIKLYSELLIQKYPLIKDNPPICEGINIISQEADKLMTLTENLLDFSRIRSGKIKLNKEPFDLCDLCQENVRMVKTMTPDRQFELKFSVEPTIILADRSRISQVLTNLLSNAVKYSPPASKVTLILNNQQSQVVFTVSDQGMGIAADKKKFIFEPFYQISNGKKLNRPAGLGLGLYITKEIIKLHQGKISVSSEPGQGSTFTVTLPIRSKAKLS